MFSITESQRFFPWTYLYFFWLTFHLLKAQNTSLWFFSACFEKHYVRGQIYYSSIWVCTQHAASFFLKNRRCGEISVTCLCHFSPNKYFSSTLLKKAFSLSLTFLWLLWDKLEALGNFSESIAFHFLLEKYAFVL